MREYEVEGLAQYAGFSLSNEAGGEWPFAGGDNLGAQRPLKRST